METKLKQCSRCKKDKVIWKNKTIDGVKNQFCKTCYNIIDRDIKKEKRKVQRKKKKEKITEKQLDSIVSKVIRTLYGEKCCTCSSVLEFSKLHNGHFISRQFRNVRFHPQNCASQCPNCNLYLQGAQYQFGKFIDNKHGEGTADMLFELSKSKDIKIGQLERNLLYQVYMDALEHKDFDKLVNDYMLTIKST